MSLIEQLALGMVCAWRALCASFRSALVLAWLPVVLVKLAVVAALAFAAHPACSWFMAPLLRATAGEDALHFPQAFARLAPLAARAAPFVWTLVVLPCATVATRVYAAGFGVAPERARSGARVAFAALAAGLPALLVAVGVQAGLDALGGARLSGLSRLVLPQLGAVVVLFVQAASLYVVAEVVLGEGGARDALAAIPRSLPPGFVPALLVLLLSALAALPFAWALPRAAAGHWHELPELAVPVALVQAAVQAFASMVACGAAALVWLGVLAGRPEEQP